jgi:hypothetical protein
MTRQDFDVQTHGVKYKSWEEAKDYLYTLLVEHGFKEVSWIDMEQGTLYFYQLGEGYHELEAVEEALNYVITDYFEKYEKLFGNIHS